jgi:homoserine dehydrogenase
VNTIRLALLGFGNAAQSFAQLLIEKESDIENSYGTKHVVTAITTKSKGGLYNPLGIDLGKALEDVSSKKRFDEEGKSFSSLSSIDVVETAEYDVLVELTPLNIFSGQPAIQHITGALSRGKDVITANKGPIAWDFQALKALAKANNCLFFYETTVMDGTPVFNMVQETLRLCKVLEIEGILNSTTNYILEELALGKAKDKIMEEGKRRGFIEADPEMDTQGWDGAAKLTALMNVLMNCNMTPDQVNRKGIDEITYEVIQEAKTRGKVIKVVCRGEIKDEIIVGSVEPIEVDENSLLGTISGTSSLVTITTDLMGKVSIVEHDPEIQQTGYGVLSDLLRLLVERSR